MAINKQIQFLRNTNKIYTSRTEAVNAIETLVNGASTKGKILDGQPILARYKDTNGKVKTVTTSVYKASNGATQVTYYDEHVDEVYVGSGTPPSTTKLAVDVTENMVSIVQNTGTGTRKTIDVMSQNAVSDALSTKVDKTDIVQSTGTSETAVMSQNAVSDALSTKVDKTELDSYATKEYVQTNAPNETKDSIEEKLGAWLEEDGGEVDGEVYTKAESDARYYDKSATDTLLDEKVDKTDIVQSTGTSTTSVMSQKAVSDIVDELEGKVNVADEEDITVIEENGKQKLKFADRNYEPLNDSGEGYKILRKNIQTIDGVRKNILTQDMINNSNTIYEIRYDFDLNGAEIPIPYGCILKFEGGSLKNGNITLDNTIIEAKPVRIFDNVVINGSINSSIYPEWFGAIPNGEVDCSEALQKAVSFGTNVVLSNGNYLCNSIIKLARNTSLTGLSYGSRITSNGIKLTMRNTVSNLLLYPVDKDTVALIDVCNDWSDAAYLGIDVHDIRCSGIRGELDNNTAVIRLYANGEYPNSGFHSLRFSNIITDGPFKYGIYVLANTTTTSKPWITAVTFEDIWFYSVKHMIYFAKTGVDNPFPYQDFKFKNVESQYNAGYSDDVVTLAGVQRTMFDGCLCWDNNGKTYEFALSDLNVSIILTNLIEENSRGDKFIKYTKDKEYDVRKLLADKVKYIQSVDGIEYLSTSHIRSETVPRKPFSLPVIYPKFKAGESNEKSFTGFSLTNNEVMSGGYSETYLGVSGSNYPVCGSKTAADGASAPTFVPILSHKYMPYSTANSRPENPVTGTLEFDSRLNIPVWYAAVEGVPRWMTSDGAYITDKVTRIKGTTVQREAMSLDYNSYGLRYYDTDLKKYVMFNGWIWTNLDGTNLKQYGTFAEKPTDTRSVPIGFKYFCTDRQTTEGATNGIEIIYKGNNIWVDALGRVVV